MKKQKKTQKDKEPQTDSYLYTTPTTNWPFSKKQPII